jgi:hypothetical protein
VFHFDNFFWSKDKNMEATLSECPS